MVPSAAGAAAVWDGEPCPDGSDWLTLGAGSDRWRGFAVSLSFLVCIILGQMRVLERVVSPLRRAVALSSLWPDFAFHAGSPGIWKPGPCCQAGLCLLRRDLHPESWTNFRGEDQ